MLYRIHEDLGRRTFELYECRFCQSKRAAELQNPHARFCTRFANPQVSFPLHLRDHARLDPGVRLKPA